MHSSWEGLNISVSFHLRYFCRFLIRALNKQRRYCLQTIPFEFYLDSTACWERGFEAFTKALWLPRQYRSIKLVDTHLIILTLTQEAPIYPGHQRIPLSRSVWRWEGAPTHPPWLVFKICTEFPIYHGVVSVNYTGDEKPERVKAASILPFWYLPEYSRRVFFFLVPTAIEACNDESFFFVVLEVQTSPTMRASGSDMMFPELHSSCGLGSGLGRRSVLLLQNTDSICKSSVFSQSPFSTWRC